MNSESEAEYGGTKEGSLLPIVAHVLRRTSYDLVAYVSYSVGREELVHKISTKIRRYKMQPGGLWSGAYIIIGMDFFLDKDVDEGTALGY